VSLVAADGRPIGILVAHAFNFEDDRIELPVPWRFETADSVTFAVAHALLEDVAGADSLPKNGLERDASMTVSSSIPSLRAEWVDAAPQMVCNLAVGFAGLSWDDLPIWLEAARRIAARSTMPLFPLADLQPDPFGWSIESNELRESNRWCDPEQSDQIVLQTSASTLTQVRLWAAATLLPMVDETEARLTLSDLLVTDARTGALGAVPHVGLTNARQRRHAIRASFHDAPQKTIGLDADPTSVDEPLVRKFHAARASKYLTQMRTTDVNVRIANQRLLRWVEPGFRDEDDKLFQDARMATVAAIAARAERAADDAQRQQRHNDAVAQKQSTRNNTLATLSLTVAVGAATFAALANSTAMKSAIGITAATILGSLGYQIAFGSQGSSRVF
jgi:hypothetical protein